MTIKQSSIKILFYHPRQGEINYAYKRASYIATPPNTSTPTSSDGPPPKRQRSAPEPPVTNNATSTPSPGTIRLTSVQIRHHKYSLGFFYGI